MSEFKAFTEQNFKDLVCAHDLNDVDWFYMSERQWKQIPAFVNKGIPFREILGKRVYYKDCADNVVVKVDDLITAEFRNGYHVTGKVSFEKASSFVPFTKEDYESASSVLGCGFQSLVVSDEQGCHAVNKLGIYPTVVNSKAMPLYADVDSNTIRRLGSREKWHRLNPVTPAATFEGKYGKGYQTCTLISDGSNWHEIKETYSCELEFPNGDRVVIPDPGDGWEEKKHMKPWGIHVFTVNDFDQPHKWQLDDEVELSFNHQTGACIAYEYTRRADDERPRVLWWTLWEQEQDK